MKKSLNYRHVGTALVLSLLSAYSFAETPLTYKGYCQMFGVSAQEPLGDRDGHAISVSNYTCRIEGGPLDGGVLTGSTINEWDKGSAVGIAGQGVVRKAGSMSVFQLGSFKLSLTMADGKVTGFVGSGQGAYKFTSGAGAVLAGKTFTYDTHSTGSGQFVFEAKVD
jgi:hypothetical protein